MKKVFLFFLIFSATLSFHGCTNEEGTDDIDVITPNDEEETLNNKEKNSVKPQ